MFPLRNFLQISCLMSLLAQGTSCQWSIVCMLDKSMATQPSNSPPSGWLGSPLADLALWSYEKEFVDIAGSVTAVQKFSHVNTVTASGWRQRLQWAEGRSRISLKLSLLSKHSPETHRNTDRTLPGTSSRCHNSQIVDGLIKYNKL